MVDKLTESIYAWQMLDMAKDPAEWQKWMNEREREELVLAERLRHAAATQLRVLKRRIKDRCIKRMRRAKDG